MFTWSTELSGLCSQGSHGDTKVYFTVLTDPSIPEPPNLTMEGRVYHAAFIRPYTAREDQRLAGAPDPDGTPRKAIRAKLEEVGLKQGNPDGTPARIINEVALSFTSSGNIDVDRELASRLVKEVEIATQWRRPK